MSFTETGGPAVQAGIYFQNCVTVLRLAEMLCGGHLPESSSGRIVSIRVEAPEEVDDTVVVWSGGCKEYIQAKLSLSPGSNTWKKLWMCFYQQYNSDGFNRTPDGDVITLAVKWTPSMVQLNNLLTRAKTAETPEEWSARLTKTQQSLLEGIRIALELDGKDLLRFCRFVQVWLLMFEGDPMKTDTFDVQTRRKLQGVIEPTTNAFSVLMDLTGRKARVRGSWDYDGLIRHLEEAGKFEELPIVDLTSPSEFQSLQPNPYQVGPPLGSPTDLFVGRDELMDAILWRLAKHYEDKMAPNAILLYGPHRSGKSSILLQLKHEVGSRFKPVFVDLNGILMTADLPNVLGTIADYIGIALLKTGIEVSLPTYEEIEKRPVKVMNALMHELVLLCAPQMPVLMLDESDTLSDFSADLEAIWNLLVFMRSLVEQSRNVFFILTSCKDIRWLADPGMSRLLTLVDDCLRVNLLSEAETIALIQEPVRDYFTYTSDALARIIELSGRHPCFVQLMCRQVVDWRNQKEVNEIALEALEDIVPDAVDRGHGQFFDLWRGLTSDERMILCGLSHVLENTQESTFGAVQAHLVSSHLHVANWDLALNRLAHIGLLDLQGNRLRMQLGLLGYWICRTPLDILLNDCRHLMFAGGAS